MIWSGGMAWNGQFWYGIDLYGLLRTIFGLLRRRRPSRWSRLAARSCPGETGRSWSRHCSSGNQGKYLEEKKNI